MAKIEVASADHYRVPLPTVFTDSTHGAMAAFELITVQLRDADGAEGVGYTHTLGPGGAAIHAMIERDLGPALIGQDGDDTERLWQHMWWTLHYAGRGGHATSAISAVDIALWDLKARRARTPLWRYFGGYDPQVPVYAGGIDFHLPLTELIDQADRFLAGGFRAVKMKVGRARLREDVERVRGMREHLGDGFPLMADANMRWSADQAIRASRELWEYDLVWLEEPIIPDDVAGHVRVLREGGLPVAAGENLHTLYEFQHVLAAGAVTYPEPDVSNCGGFTVFRKICALAEAHNLPVTSHGVHDLTVHAMAAAPNRTYMEVHGFALDRYMAQPLEIHDGYVLAPERPGHGIELDWNQMEAHRV